MTSIQDDKKRWEEETLNPVLGRYPERKGRFATQSDIEMERVYLPDGEVAEDHRDKFGFPGEYPYTH